MKRLTLRVQKVRYVYLPNLGVGGEVLRTGSDGKLTTGLTFQPILEELVNPKIECIIRQLPWDTSYNEPLSITGYSVEIREWIEVDDAVDH